MQKNHTNQEKDRDLFAELFPLTKENKALFEKGVHRIFEQMFDTEGKDKLMAYQRTYQQATINFEGLTIDTLGWKEPGNFEGPGRIFGNEYGDYMHLSIVQPNGPITKESPSQLEVYRNWLRDQFVQVGGGLISCEDYIGDHGIEAYESISKVPREEGTGMDYVYFLNIRNYEAQLLYQINVKVYEQSPTGLRDNIFMHPLCDIAGIDMGDLMDLYRKDPYDPNFTEGNIRNLSEMQDFDHLFPFHPLSLIRREIQSKIKSSLQFN